MDTPIGRPGADLRDYLAEERTFLAWIRTGLALMGLGFVVARFGLFLQEIQITQGGSAAQPHALSLWLGTALIAAGVAVNLLSARRHMSMIRKWNWGQFVDHRLAKQGVSLALFLASVGIIMAIYLTVTFCSQRPADRVGHDGARKPPPGWRWRRGRRCRFVLRAGR
jgi:putative membrane protein